MGLFLKNKKKNGEWKKMRESILINEVEIDVEEIMKEIGISYIDWLSYNDNERPYIYIRDGDLVIGTYNQFQCNMDTVRAPDNIRERFMDWVDEIYQSI